MLVNHVSKENGAQREGNLIFLSLNKRANTKNIGQWSCIDTSVQTYLRPQVF